MEDFAPLRGDGRLHVRADDFNALVEQTSTIALKLTDGNGLLVYVRFDPGRVKQMAFDMLSQLTHEAGRGEPHYDLVVGGI